MKFSASESNCKDPAAKDNFSSVCIFHLKPTALFIWVRTKEVTQQHAFRQASSRSTEINFWGLETCPVKHSSQRTLARLVHVTFLVKKQATPYIPVMCWPKEKSEGLILFRGGKSARHKAYIRDEIFFGPKRLQNC